MIPIPNSGSHPLLEENPCREHGTPGEPNYPHGKGTKIELPEDPDRYFIRDANTRMVPLSDVETIRARPEGIAHAEPLMRNAYEGTGGRRGPVTLTPKEGGGFKVLDGNSTVAIARKHGWKAIPAQVLTTEAELDAFHKAEAEKAEKKAGQAKSDQLIKDLNKGLVRVTDADGRSWWVRPESADKYRGHMRNRPRPHPPGYPEWDRPLENEWRKKKPANRRSTRPYVRFEPNT